MFAFFVNDSFCGFWSNLNTDIFCSLTIKSMKWNESDVDLVYYDGLINVPNHFELDENKNLIVKKRVIVSVEKETTNELGEIVKIFENEYQIQDDFILNPTVYFSKGLFLKSC